MGLVGGSVDSGMNKTDSPGTGENGVVGNGMGMGLWA